MGEFDWTGYGRGARRKASVKPEPLAKTQIALAVYLAIWPDMAAVVRPQRADFR